MSGDVNLRLAEESDIPAILGIAQTFVAESAYGYTYSQARSESIITAYLSDPYHAVVVAEGEQGLAGIRGLDGIWIGAIVHEWTNEPICYLAKFYVMPWARGKGVAKLLRDSFVRWADDNGCLDIFVTSTANIGAGPAFEKLFRGVGFVDCGQTLMRRKPRQ